MAEPAFLRHTREYQQPVKFGIMDKSEDLLDGEQRNFDDLYEQPSGNLKRSFPSGYEESLLSLDEQEALKRVKSIPDSLTVLKPLPVHEEPKKCDSEGGAPASKTELTSHKIHVGCIPANLGEAPLHQYFSQFGEIQHLVLVRDYETGISKGYAFITYANEMSALNALKAPSHNLEHCHYIRVSPATSKFNPERKKTFHLVEDIILPDQKRIYMGPLFESISNEEIRSELKSYGAVKGIIRHPKTTHHLGYCAVEFAEGISIRRLFGQKISVGNSSKLKITCSRSIMELLLSPNVVYFHEAYLKCEHTQLDKYFSSFGKVYRAMQFTDQYKTCFKSYGFIDFVEASSVDKVLEKRSHLISPGQFVRLTKYLPMHLCSNMCAIGDQEAQSALRAIESIIPESGTWGESASRFNIQTKKDEMVSSQVRFPVKLVSKLIGERGKTIAEITRDSKCKIIVPKVKEGEPNIVVSIKGLRSDIKTAQYLMQKAIKS